MYSIFKKMAAQACTRFRQLFGSLDRPAVIGMVHVKGLPGRLEMREIL